MRSITSRIVSRAMCVASLLAVMLLFCPSLWALRADTSNAINLFRGQTLDSRKLRNCSWIDGTGNFRQHYLKRFYATRPSNCQHQKLSP